MSEGRFGTWDGIDKGMEDVLEIEQETSFSYDLLSCVLNILSLHTSLRCD